MSAPDDAAKADGIIRGACYRITLLTDRLIRMEYSPDGAFEDRPTQTVVCRGFKTPEYQVFRTESGIQVQTNALTLYYDEKPFSANGLWIENRSECRGIYCTWHYGDKLTENLGGTARTLDEADGAIPLENGILSRLQGYSVLDDSASFVCTEDGWFEPRPLFVSDLYFFGYGYAYLQALEDFFRLCGPTPLLPRYALGNWWSRFHAYSEDEYLTLMERFQKAGVPLSVAVLDMDWHITRPGGGAKGWTGYTWNRELFPDPSAFLSKLHRMGLKVTLNVHPAEGAQAHEEMYAQMALALGRDADKCQRIPFDVSNRAFMKAYFLYLYHPREAEGVDFWWIDWQQGETSRLKGLDPLWVLSALHTKDGARNGKRPLILSRYAGPGSHRYPLGFSGDSVISWKSLAFQPYFTASASNIGYGWWSHDIGGHTHGSRDDELQVRWLQLGVFSPILRMHSTSNPFNGKEPWRYPKDIEWMMEKYLRLRHRLIPYVYTMNWRCHSKGRMLVEPMYYRYPECDDAYHVPNQYFFGSELIACPITTPTNPETQTAQVTAWLPEGLYYDIMTGERYRGGRGLKLFRPLSQIPVFAAQGAIVPMTHGEEAAVNGVSLPHWLEIWAFAGADGEFTLYEDDGETMEYQNGAYGLTHIALRWGVSPELVIAPDCANARVIEQRSYQLCLMGVTDRREVSVQNSRGEALRVSTEYEEERHVLKVLLTDVPLTDACTIRLSGQLRLRGNDVLIRCEALLNRAQMDYELKEKVFSILSGCGAISLKISQLAALSLSEYVFNELIEQLTLEEETEDGIV